MFRFLHPAGRAYYSSVVLKGYQQVQSQYPNHFVFYQVGDFFEVYGEKKVNEASRLLNLSIARPNDPLRKFVGFPLSSLDRFVHKLMEQGKCAVVCEQVPVVNNGGLGKSDSGKKATTFTREISRIFTPGTVIGDDILEQGRNNYLLSIHISPVGDFVALAWAEVSTGYHRITSCRVSDLPNFLSRLNPSEIIVDQRIFQNNQIKVCLEDFQVQVLPDCQFDIERYEELAPIFHGASTNHFRIFTPLEMSAASALLFYIKANNPVNLPKLDFPIKWDHSSQMNIDYATIQSLELKSLLDCLDQTITGGGGRLFQRNLLNPSCNINEIERRLDRVEYFANDPLLLHKCRERFKKICDLERLMKRLETHSSTSFRDLLSTPRDLLRIASSLKSWSNEIFPLTMEYPKLLQLYPDIIDDPETRMEVEKISDEIERALVNDFHQSRYLDQIIKDNYDQSLDEKRESVRDSKSTAEKMKEICCATFGSDFKIREIRKLGLVVEVKRKSATSIASENGLIQGFDIVSTTKTYIRYQNSDMKKATNDKALSLDAIKVLEMEIFDRLLKMFLKKASSTVYKIARLISAMDVSSSIAEHSVENHYCRPQIDSTLGFRVKEGRHPMVENSLLPKNRYFQPNDCILQKPFWLITGPNMGGKSTFLRQNAVITIMAQSGMFVPAESAQIGIVDAIYTRIGASDDLSRDKSTFMVEMTETASILKSATQRSLVIIDELGRGTCHKDGLAVAFAVAKHLIEENKCRSLFATHYHNLVDYLESTGNIECYCTILSKETAPDGSVKLLFDHQVKPGHVKESMGIEIADLAGIPAPVIKEAKLFRESIINSL